MHSTTPPTQHIFFANQGLSPNDKAEDRDPGNEVALYVRSSSTLNTPIYWKVKLITHIPLSKDKITRWTYYLQTSNLIKRMVSHYYDGASGKQNNMSMKPKVSDTNA